MKVLPLVLKGFFDLTQVLIDLTALQILLLSTTSNLGTFFASVRPSLMEVLPMSLSEGLQKALLSAPDSQLDDSMVEKVKEWSTPPKAIQILEVLDHCVRGSLASEVIVKALQMAYEDTCKKEGTTHEEVVKLATWRASVSSRIGGDFKQYISSKQRKELRPYLLGEDLSGVEIRSLDLLRGCPRSGDWIARSPTDSTDQWLVSTEEFDEQKYIPFEDVQEIRALISSFVKSHGITHIDLLYNDKIAREQGINLLAKLVRMVGLHPEP
jgi:hypothetical protein